MSDAVLITGAAGSIGRATVSAFEERGLRVATIDRAEADLTDDAAAGAAIAAIEGPLRHVVAIAGGGDPDELAQDDAATEPFEVFDRVVRNNLHTAFTTIRHAVPRLRELDGDRAIVLVSSINAYGGYGAPGYSAAKAGLGGLAAALAPPLGADGIRIACLTLGTVDTENLRALGTFQGRPLDLDAVAEKAPLKRVLTPADVAAALAAMTLDMPGLTGTTIVLDNGQTLTR